MNKSHSLDLSTLVSLVENLMRGSIIYQYVEEMPSAKEIAMEIIQREKITEPIIRHQINKLLEANGYEFNARRVAWMKTAEL